jgi:hypothetical protein
MDVEHAQRIAWCKMSTPRTNASRIRGAQYAKMTVNKILDEVSAPPTKFSAGTYLMAK